MRNSHKYGKFYFDFLKKFDKDFEKFTEDIKKEYFSGMRDPSRIVAKMERRRMARGKK